MKTKITSLFIFISTFLLSINLHAQTVTGIASNNGCQNSGIVTASSTGLGATPQYQLLRAGVVVSPVPGDNTQFTNNPVFTGLSSGTYVVNGRATSGGTVFSSANIAVTDGYLARTVTTPTKVAGCVGGTAVLTTTTTNGQPPFTYTIAAQAAPGTILQNSGPISLRTFTFNVLPKDNYLVSVTDNCGQTITGATSISDPTVSLADIKLGTFAFPSHSTIFNCSTPLIIDNQALFQYIANSTTLSPADAANFTWKVKYQGQLYGKDIDGDGYSDIGGDGYSPLFEKVTMPVTATRADMEADMLNMKVVLIDNCGNTKEFPITPILGYIRPFNCSGAGIVSVQANRISCYPVNMTFTNIANPSDVITRSVSDVIEAISGFTAGATYHVDYIDAQGYTTGNFPLPASQNITIPSSPSVTINQLVSGVQPSLNYLNYGRLILNINPFETGDTINYTVMASTNPLIPVGYTGSTALNASGNAYLQLPAGPSGYFPKGNYTLQVQTDCDTKTLNVVVQGYTASLSGYTTTPVCGGFNYVMNGNFDVANAYQVIIVSGPSSVGQVRDLASTTASLPFNGLSYGTYVFGLRIKGGTLNVLTQTVTYDASNAIIVDKTNTGGYVCATGATNGVLTITAVSNSPSPGDVLQYALSTDGGNTYSAYQSGNTFGGLTDATYYFKIQDGCGNVITQSVQIGVAAAPDATADGLTTPATICNLTSGTVQLDVDILGALSYLWTGPGINASNQALKDPLINYADLAVGANNYTCTVTLGAPCNSNTISNLTINVNPAPAIVITDPASVCTPNAIDITAPSVTAGSDVGLTYTYFSDDAATAAIAVPSAITTRGTYYIKGTNTNGCSTIVPVNVTVNDLPTASISYLDNPYCQIGTAIPEQLETGGGTYSSDPGLIIDINTGEIDLVASTAGDHTITYTFSDGSCSNTTTAIITINPLPVATISYPNGPYCNRGTVTSTETGVANGIYTSDTGLSINQTTGEINLESSTPGTYTIIYSFSNGSCSDATTSTITINETVLPTPLSDVTAECSIIPTAPTLTDPCAGTIIGTTSTILPINTQGRTVITWTFDYGDGFLQTIDQNIIIDDITPPVVPILADITGECSAMPTVPTATDACVGIITGTTATVFPITAQGTTVVVWTFDDGNGNISTANQNVIIDDETPPLVPILADVTGECSATPTVPTATDACAGIITGTTATVFPITAQGTTVVTWSFDDGNGNISTADQNVIIKDITAPAVPVLADVTGECSGAPTAPTATDNCSGTITGTTTTLFPITAQGTTVVTWNFDDGNGNISTANQNVIIDDITPPNIPILADITGQCNVTPVIPTTTDACAGIITGVTTSAFPITNPGTTVITWTFNDGNGNSVTANQNVIISQIVLAGAETAACSSTQPGYNITLSVTGQAPYTATGTGAPGTWSGNAWTSGLISSGTNYNVNFQDASACNTVNIAGISPNCCRFSVICPTFQPTSVQCYEELPSAVNLTEAQFEALGNGDGRIADTRCGVVEITASNGADPGCNANVTRTYTITEYADANSNGVRDAGENTVLDAATCAQTILIHDTTAPVFAETLPQATITADCDTIPPAQTFTATDNCGSTTVAYDEQRVEGDCASRYSLIRTWTASDNCGNQNSFVQTVNVSCVEEVYNAVSVNGDGLNDSFFIKGIDCYPDNKVKIYNRYGVIVYEKNGYDNVTNPFQGFSDGRATVARGNKLPTGTYFYTLEYDSNGKKVEKAGYLYVNSQ
ncbi:gliding motility-associated C-terminal domain-containing protein [Flavobacterium chungangensis]|uniref:Gliding motility-associated C-terminal domain-containing protein n=1 Tax=Flavobacterium chungangensis TaxID=2708132 RepID=A0ABV8ZQW1_9FLAO